MVLHLGLVMVLQWEMPFANDFSGIILILGALKRTKGLS